MKARPKKAAQPSWDGIAPSVRDAYEKRVAELEVQSADPIHQERLEVAVAMARTSPPPWVEEGSEPMDQEPNVPAQPSTANIKKLKAARKKVELYAVVLRSDAFDDWVRRYVDEAQRPDEWTQARTLYESYIKQAKDYGGNRSDKAIAKQELATETGWGKMMGSLFPKKRRRNGWYYPLVIKRISR